MSVVTRFAPSPTGLLHAGNARTALIAYLFAKSQNGKFILRIDDTDLLRSKDEFKESLIEDLSWLGIKWDEQIKQSDRIEKYNKAKQFLIDEGLLYPCYESAEEIDLKRKSLLARNMPPIYDRSALELTSKQIQELEASGKKPHWRFLLKGGKISWEDSSRGNISFDAQNISDPILIRTDQTMTYMISSVVDDIDLGITDIIRGEDHISNSAIHVRMFEALGAKIPNFAHISLLKSQDGKMSKRDRSGFDLRKLREEGIQPMAINSFLSKIGTIDNIELANSMNDLCKDFSLAKFSKSSAIYNPQDMIRLNSKLIKKTPYQSIKQDFNITENQWDAIKGNITHLSDISKWQNILSHDFIATTTDAQLIASAAQLLPSAPWNEKSFSTWIAEIKKSTQKSGKTLFMPVRMALTGMPDGPELYEIFTTLGFDEVERRLFEASNS